MADIIKTTSILKLLAGFTDEDDRTISLNNPRGGITSADIHSLAQKAQNVLIGDKFGAEFSRFKSATYVARAEVTLDLTL